MTHRLFQVGAVSDLDTGRLERITREGTEYKYYVLNPYKLSYKFNNGEEKNITVPEDFCLRGPKGTPFPYPSAAWVFKEWIYANQGFDGGRSIHRRQGDNIIASILIKEKRSQVKSRWWGGDRSSHGAADWRRARKSGPVYSSTLFSKKEEEETAPKSVSTEKAPEPAKEAPAAAKEAPPAEKAAPKEEPAKPAEKAAPKAEPAKPAAEAPKPTPAAAPEAKKAAEPAKPAEKPAEAKAPAKTSAAPAK